MAGGYYTALSGMRARMDALDRIASDIANGSTTGYKAERAGTIEAGRPSFGAVLQSAIDVTNGEARVDTRPGALATTGRSLDVSIEGRGFFVVETQHGTRYSRNGHMVRRADGVLTNDEGDVIQGASGEIKVANGEVEIDPNGTIRSGGAVAGVLKVVDFSPNAKLEREGGSRFRVEETPTTIEKPSIRSGSLEQSNANVVERIAELSEVTRSFDTLLKAVTVLMNDVDRGAITELGRK